MFVSQIDIESGKKDTFANLLQRCIRVALYMADKQITRADVITLCTTHHLNTVVPYIATQFLGAKLNCINPLFPLDEIKYIMDTLRPIMIFAVPEVAAVLEEMIRDLSLASVIVVFGRSKKHLEFCDFLKPHANEDKFEPIKIDDLRETALYSTTSGSTGLLKIVSLNHYSFLGQSPNFIIRDHTNDDIHLSYITLGWISADFDISHSLRKGYCRLLSERFDGEGVWNTIDKYKPTVVVIPPGKVIEMLDHRKGNGEVHSVLDVMILGEKLSKNYKLQLREIFTQASVREMYGQTEVGGLVASFNPNNKHHQLMQKKNRENRVCRFSSSWNVIQGKQ